MTGYDQSAAPVDTDLQEEELDLEVFEEEAADTEEPEPEPGIGKGKIKAFTGNKTSSKGDLVQYLELLNLPDSEFEKLKKLKKADLLIHLRANYGSEDALDSSSVTGVDPTDVLHQVMIEVESLDDEDKARDVLAKLAEDASACRFRIGGVMAHIHANGWYPGEDFFAYVKSEFGFDRRVAQRMQQGYYCLTSCGASFKDAKKIGWSVLVEAAAPHLTPENWKDIFEGVEGLSIAGAKEWIKNYLGQEDIEESEGGEGGETDPDQVGTLKFKYYNEDMKEAIEIGLELAGQAGDKPTNDRGHQLYRAMLAFASNTQVSVAGGALAEIGTLQQAHEYLASVIEQLGKKFTAEAPDFHMAVIEAVDANLPGDLDHWPDGAPELTELDFLAELFETLEGEGPEAALVEIAHRQELLGADIDPRQAEESEYDEDEDDDE